MKCTQCGHENREGARFCTQCRAEISALTGQSHTSPMGNAVEAQNGAGNQVNAANDGKTTRTLPSNAESGEATSGGTAPLPELHEMFAPLPAGALLGDGRYAALEARPLNPQLNEYLTEDLVTVRLCPSCGAVTPDLEERYCVSCGAEISGAPAVNLRYRIHESANPEFFAQEAQLLAMRLQHPALRLPLAVFIETPYGAPRQYRVAPEFPLPRVTTLSIPQEINTVLEWGVSLAQGLAYLHQHQVTIPFANPKHIVFDGKRALWINLEQSVIITPEKRANSAEYFALDVKALAASLLYLATGKQKLTQDMALPEPVKALFFQAITNPQGMPAEAFASELDVCLQELRRPASVTFMVGRRTDVGQVRSLNEDSLLTLDLSAVFRSKSEPVGVFVVADGMGGHDAGDIASQITARTIGRIAIAELFPPVVQGKPIADPAGWLKTAAQAANQAVYEQRKSAGSDMGTTLVATLVRGDQALVANVGDSRCYHLTPAGMRQVTTDHSLVERLVATGQITAEEAAYHPQRNVIYRVIGDKLRLEVDLFEVNLQPGEALLLCSDGLSGMVPNDQIWQLWHTSSSPQHACDRLVQAANQAGGEDNVTVVILQIL
ncbi:MAG: Stp1/IreP family PP2C-type Ser/Thr phosphatase [Anaerolineae bacterium]|nr:Stp1/IreP family PP2C-type Ser/Thr phosphatase [Anaerolineae bacterium]